MTEQNNWVMTEQKGLQPDLGASKLIKNFAKLRILKRQNSDFVNFNLNTNRSPIYTFQNLNRTAHRELNS